MEETLKYKMYSLVMYNLSGEQKGIQAYHASMRYAREYFNDADFQQWIHQDETVVILSGGGSQDMILNCEEIKLLNIKFAKFHEPDLNFSMSGISFLLDERVWNKEKYPDMRDYMKINHPEVMNRDFHKYEKEWIEMLGGKDIVAKRLFKDKFRRA
jgi:hypothetical protein